MGHRGHHAESGEDENYGDSCAEQAADAVVDLGFGFGELANGANVGFGKFSLKVGDVLFDLSGCARCADLDETDSARQSCETLRHVQRRRDLIIFGTSGRPNVVDATILLSAVTP